MKIYDISMDIYPDMMVYNNYEHKKPILENIANHDSSHYYETDIRMNLHTGTHIDAPLHMIKDGETVEVYELERFICKAKVFDLTFIKEMIRKSDLIALDIQPDDFVLFKTQNSNKKKFDFEFISLAEDGAKYLVEIGINGVGIDALGIERDQDNHMTHIRLLSENIIIMEGLDLKAVEEGEYQLIALPIKIRNVEAAPVRAILIKE